MIKTRQFRMEESDFLRLNRFIASLGYAYTVNEPANATGDASKDYRVGLSAFLTALSAAEWVQLKGHKVAIVQIEMGDKYVEGFGLEES